jgi:hypothetical protein
MKTKLKIELQPNVKAFLIRHGAYRRFIKSARSRCAVIETTHKESKLKLLRGTSYPSTAILNHNLWCSTDDGYKYWDELCTLAGKHENKLRRKGLIL